LKRFVPSSLAVKYFHIAITKNPSPEGLCQLHIALTFSNEESVTLLLMIPETCITAGSLSNIAGLTSKGLTNQIYKGNDGKNIPDGCKGPTTGSNKLILQ